MRPVCFALIGILVTSIVEVHGIEGNAPNKLHAFRTPIPAVPTRSSQENRLDSPQQVSDALSSDPTKVWLLQKIDEAEQALENPELDANYRRIYETALFHLQGRLLQRERRFREPQPQGGEALHSEDKLSWPPGIAGADPIEASLEGSVLRYEHYLKSTDLAPHIRNHYERMLAEFTSKLDDYRTGAQLFANAYSVLESKDAERIAKAEQELADFLAARLNRVEGASYPSGMSLAAVTEAFQKQDSKLDKRKVVLATLILLLMFPIALFVFYKLRDLKLRHK